MSQVSGVDIPSFSVTFTWFMHEAKERTEFSGSDGMSMHCHLGLASSKRTSPVLHRGIRELGRKSAHRITYSYTTVGLFG
ncbi:hypothetical protein CGMCC3_g5753 [Colletotrichum fructicola]|nr:uncharacterized protein CGMCC3_g5753 [Colletotrichum fructicola]KAE9578393.1 hypothetical protein CGMCC3_g5753 [Colletotrichum fructicola]